MPLLPCPIYPKEFCHALSIQDPFAQPTRSKQLITYLAVPSSLDMPCLHRDMAMRMPTGQISTGSDPGCRLQTSKKAFSFPFQRTKSPNLALPHGPEHNANLSLQQGRACGAHSKQLGSPFTDKKTRLQLPS